MRWLAAAALCAGAVSAATGAELRLGEPPVICHERRVEIIVGGVDSRGATACPKTAVDSDRGQTRHAGDARIPAATQNARDTDRRAILQQELDRAEAELEQQPRTGAGDDPRAMARKREDIAALRRELQATARSER